MHRRWSWAGVAAVCLASGMALAAEPDKGERLVHRFLQVELSPDGAFVASVEGDSPENGFYPQIRDLLIRRAHGGAETKIALPCGHVPQCWPGFPSWSADSQHLNFTLRTPGSHSYAVYTVATDGSNLTRLLDFRGTIADLHALPDGRLAMLAIENARKEVGATEAGVPVAGDLDQPSPEQRIAVLENGSLQWASPADLFVYEYDWLPDGKSFIGTAAPGDGDNNWWTAKLYSFGGGGARVLYAPTDPRQQIAAPKVARNGRSVAFIGGIMSDFGSTGGDVYALSMAGGAPVDLTPGMPASASSLFWGCNDHLTAELLAGDQTQIVDLGEGKRQTQTRVLWSAMESLSREGPGVSWSCASGTTAVSHESFTAPPEIATGALGKWKNLTAVNAGMTTPAHVQSLHWKSDELDVQGWLLLPERAAGKMPMVTSVHGGPAGAVRPSFRGPGLFQTLLERGYAIFFPNPRGSFGQGERFAAANVRDLGHGDLRDVLAGIDAAGKVAPIDPARLGITGGSYGGFMTMWAVTQTDRFKAAVAIAGISDWQSYYGENGIDAWLLPYFGASAYQDPEVYARSSPINFIRNVRTPTFAYVGELDIECPAPQTQEFWHALKELGIPTAVMIYAGEGHGLRQPDHTADAMRRTIEWFERYLK
jgi:dipeptidyl aminopeptidase/acylaminoacyl peptidase